MSDIKKRCVGVLSAVLLFVFSFCPINAVFADSLNTVMVPLTDASQSQLTPAIIQQAFIRVLVKLSGNEHISTLPEVQKLMVAASSYIKSYSIIHAEHTDTYQMQVTFDGGIIKKLLLKSGQPLWTEPRPQTMVAITWQQSQWDTPQDNAQVTQALQDVSQYRGVRFVQPLMDLNDQNQLHLNASQPLQQFMLQSQDYLQRRYQIAQQLIGVISQPESAVWRGTWQFTFQGATYTWQLQAASVSDLVQNILNTVADTMANRMSIVQGNQLASQLVLQITGIDNIKSYATLLRLLNKLAVVSQVQVQHVAQDSIWVHITSSAGEQGLIRALNHQKKLRYQKVYQNENHQTMLTYAWSGPAAQAS